MSSAQLNATQPPRSPTPEAEASAEEYEEDVADEEAERSATRTSVSEGMVDGAGPFLRTESASMSALANNESWASKISAAEFAAERAALGGSLERAITPLRPDDSMIRRVAAHDKLVEKKSALLASVALSGSLKLKRLATTKPSPTSAKGVSPPQVVDHAAQLRRMFPEINSARKAKSPHASDDPYSAHEKDLVAELNLCRGNPKGYADLIAQVLLIGAPFVPVEGEKVTFGRLKVILAQLVAEVQEISAALAALDDSEKKEVAVLKEQWAMDDAERSKRSKKTVAPKKGSGKGDDKFVDEATAAQNALEAERDLLIREVSQKNQANRAKLHSRLDAAQRRRDQAQSGVRLVEQCAAKLSSTPPLAGLTWHRGLSLAARDLISEPQLSVVEACLRYGSFPLLEAQEGTTVVLHQGAASIRQTVMEMLLCLDDPKRKARNRLLDPRVTLVGAGWRRDKQAVTRSTLVLTTLFEELEAIAQRDYMPLQDVRRLLKEAVQLNSRTLLVFKDPLVVPHTPKSHPMVCETGAVVSVCSPHTIGAALFNLRETVPSMPSTYDGEMFIQREGERVDIHCAIPYKANFGLAIFAAPRGSYGAGITSAFALVGVVKIHADGWHITKRNVSFPSTFPKFTTAFSEREAFLVEPLCGTLKPLESYRFEIVIPITQYFATELSKISEQLAGAKSVSSGGREEAQKLQQLYEAAVARADAAVQNQQQVGPLQHELLTLQKDVGKKRGKELEKVKSQIAELEQQIAALEGAVTQSKAELAEAAERIQFHRRHTRQASALRRRYLTEQAQLTALTDRSHPVEVEVTLEERRTRLTPCDDSLTRYAATLQIPRAGAVSLFIGGIVSLTWQVGESRTAAMVG